VYDLEAEGERVSLRVVEEEVRNLVAPMKREWWVKEKRARLEREGRGGRGKLRRGFLGSWRRRRFRRLKRGLRVVKGKIGCEEEED